MLLCTAQGQVIGTNAINTRIMKSEEKANAGCVGELMSQLIIHLVNVSWCQGKSTSVDMVGLVRQFIGIYVINWSPKRKGKGRSHW